MKHRLTLFGSMILLTGFSGCVTFTDPGPSAAEQEDMNILREDLNRVQGRMETVELENRRMAKEIEKFRAESADTRNPAAIQERLDTLERQIQAVNAAREKDKQSIVNQLSGKIAEIMGQRSHRPARSATASGHEHIVKPGETLSSIAVSYKVKSSALIKANDLENPDALRAGQKLVIPR